MKRKDDRWVPVVASVLCVALLLGGYGYCCRQRPAGPHTTVTQMENTNELSPIPEGTSGEAVATETSAVAGEVVTEFLKPYNANTAYNRVYVQNKTDNALDVENLLKTPVDVRFAKEEAPVVLIVHTHTTECYLPQDRAYYTAEDATRTTDPSLSVCAVGEAMKQVLNEAGYGVLHDTTVHDTTYTGSYKRSAATIASYLQAYPTIRLVIDLHRDSVARDETTKVKPVVMTDDGPAAQVMLVLGDGRGVSGFENWEQNLAFGVRFQQTMEVLHPGLARAMTFLDAKYNQDLAPVNLLLEVGTEANSVEEACRGGRMAAEALRHVLNTLAE